MPSRAVPLLGVAPEVYRLMDLHGIVNEASHLLHIRFEPQFEATTAPTEDLPELDSMAERWRAFVDTQPLEGIDRDRLGATGAEYIERAIDAAIEAGTD